jgi:Chaperone of endosialidase
MHNLLGPLPPPITHAGPLPPPEVVSDIRLKTDIQQVGTTAHSLPLYTFRYIGKDDLYEGVMAQDVLKVMPAAVSVGEDGYYRVRYDMLGIKMHHLG